MNELGKGFDGTVEKAITSTEKLKNLPEILQKYMMWGDYKSGLITKIDGSKFGDSIDGENIQNYVAQISNLDKAQRDAIISVTKLDKESKAAIQDLIDLIQTGSRINGKVFETSLKSAGNSEINQGDVNSLMGALGMKNGDNYALPNTNEVKKNLNMWAKAAENADAKTRLMNAGIIESTKNGYAMTDSFKKMIGIEEVDGVVKTGLTAKQLALNAAMQIGKQLLFSLGVTAAAFVASKIIDYISNLKTRSEELVDAMNDSHDAAEQATKDVEEIQSKIDELNDSLEAAGVKKIEDIVDPVERERLQTVNDMLQAQLELKKQLEKDANDKANADTSTVVNDKTEKSIVKKKTVYLDVNGESTDNPTEAVTTFDNIGEDITKTESLQEHTAALNELIDKRRELATAGKEDTQEYKDNEATITSETQKVKALSTAVSENMSGYETDADSFVQYKDEYVAGTNAMTAATKALANAQDNTGIDTTNLDIFSEKVRQIKNDMDNGDSQQSDWKMFNGLGAFSGMTGESIINIDKDTTNQTDAEKAALEKLHQVADDNKISFENLIGVFEAFGIIQTSNISAADSYAEQLEKTMGVIDDIQSAYKTCSTAVEEYNKYGYMSVDSLQSLLQMDDEYLNTLELVNGKLQVNQSAYADLLATQYAEAQMEAISQAISELNAIAKGDAAEKSETFTEATEDEKNKLTALCPALKDATVGTGELAAALAAAQGAADGGDADAIQTKIDGVMNALNTRLSLISTNMAAAMNSANGLKNQLNGFSDSTKNASKSTSSFLDAWSTLSSAMEEYNKWGGISLNTMKSLMGIDAKYTSCLKKRGNELVVDATACRDLIQAELKQAAATDDGTDKVTQYNQVLEYLDAHAKNGTISLNQLKDAIEGVNTALDEATGKTDEFQSGMQILHDLSKIDNANGEQIADYDTLKKVTELVSKHPELNGIFLDENGNLNVDDDKIKKAAGVLIQDVIDAANDSRQTGLAKLWSNRLEQLDKGNISMTDFWNGFGTDIEDANTKLDKFQSAFSTFRSALEEIQQTGVLKSQDILQELGQIDQSFLDQFAQGNGTYKINATGLRDMYVKQLEPLMKQFEGTVYGDYLQKMYDAVRAPTDAEYDALIKATLEYKAAEAKCNAALAQIDKSDASDEDKEAAKKAALDELAVVYNQKYQDVQETDAQVMAKLIAHWEDAKDAVESFKSALSDIKDLLSSFLSLLSTWNDNNSNDLKLWGDVMGDVIDKRIEALNKQKEALEENNDATERAIELAKAQDELARAEQQRTSRVYTENGYEWQADPEAVRTARQDLNDKQRQWNKEDAEKAIDDQIKKYNEFKDKLSEVMDDIGKSWEDYQKELQYTAQIQDMTLGQMEGSLDGYHNKIIANLQNSGTISGIQTVISNLESLIGTLEKLNNVYNFLQTGTYTDGGFVGLVNTVKKVFGKNSSTSITKTITNSLDTITDATEVTFGGSGITGVINNSMTDGVKNAVVNAQKELGSATTKNGLIGVFQNAWDAIGSGAKSLFSNSSSNSLTSIFSDGISNIGKIISNAFGGKGAGTSGGSGILGWLGNLLGIGGVSLSSVPAMTATNTAGLTGLSKLVADGAIGANVAGAGGTAVAAAGGSSLLAGIPIVSALLFGLGAAGNHFAGLNKIWKSNDDTGTKIGKTLFSTVFNSSGGILSVAALIHDTIGRANDKKNGTTSKTLAEKVYEWPIWFWNWGKKTTSQLDDVSKNTKDTADDVKKKENKTNITVNAVQTTVNNGNKTSDSSGPSGSSSSSVSNGQQKQQSFWDKFWGSKFWFWNWGKKAVGDKGVKHTGTYNVDEQGSELIVRQPQSGRYTYLETGDGVVPADITSRLFEMGGNPDKWFTDQMAKHSTATMVQSRNPGGISMTIGDVNVNNPVGDTDALARQIVQQLPNKMVQRLNKR